MLYKNLKAKDWVKSKKNSKGNILLWKHSSNLVIVYIHVCANFNICSIKCFWWKYCSINEHIGLIYIVWGKQI